MSEPITVTVYYRDTFRWYGDTPPTAAQLQYGQDDGPLELVSIEAVRPWPYRNALTNGRTQHSTSEV